MRIIVVLLLLCSCCKEKPQPPLKHWGGPGNDVPNKISIVHAPKTVPFN